MSSTGGLSPPRKRTRLACKACRQSKVRCSSAGEPCSRCLRLGISCIIDPGFQRATRRVEIERLERQIQHLQDQQTSNDSNVDPLGSSKDRAEGSRPAASSVQSTLVDSGVLLGNQAPGISRSTSISHMRTLSVAATDWKISDVTLEKSDGERLIRLYFTRYHPFLPILDPDRSPQAYYAQSKVLFWTLIAIAARQDHTSSILLSKIRITLDSMLRRMLFDDPASLAHIQVMILWATWPLPNLRFWNDNMLLTINIALPYAMQLGLHKYGSEEEYSRAGFFVKENVLDQSRQEADHDARRIFRNSAWHEQYRDKVEARQERSRTWAALLATHQSCVLEWGHVPILGFSDPGNDMPFMPKVLQAHATLQHFMQSAAFEVNAHGRIGDHNTEGFYNTMNKLEQQFALIQARAEFHSEWITRLRVQAMKLYLRLFYFLDDGTDQRKDAAMVATFDTALSLVSDIVVADESTYDLLPYAPLAPARWIFNAALVLLRISFSSLAPSIDSRSAKVSYHAAAFAIRKLAVIDPQGQDLLRLPTRLSGVLSALWKRAEQDSALRQSRPRLQVKSRLGNNLQADCLILLRDYRLAELNGLPTGSREAHSRYDEAAKTATSLPFLRQEGEAENLLTTSPPVFGNQWMHDTSFVGLQGSDLDILEFLDPFAEAEDVQVYSH